LVSIHQTLLNHILIPNIESLRWIEQFSRFFSGMRMNKPLYTISYTLATAGAAGLLFAGIYALVGLLEPENIGMLASSIISETHGNCHGFFRWICTGSENLPFPWNGWGSTP
jgi:hypothetical protein